jgi:hypothetical protein
VLYSIAPYKALLWKEFELIPWWRLQWLIRLCRFFSFMCVKVFCLSHKAEKELG